MESTGRQSGSPLFWLVVVAVVALVVACICGSSPKQSIADEAFDYAKMARCLPDVEIPAKAVVRLVPKPKKLVENKGSSPEVTVTVVVTGTVTLALPKGAPAGTSYQLAVGHVLQMKAGGAFELHWSGQDALIERSGGFYQLAGDTVFDAAEDSVFEAAVAKTVADNPLAVNGDTVTMPAGTKLVVSGKSFKLSLRRTAVLTRWLDALPDSLEWTREAGPSPRIHLTVQAARHGLPIDRAKLYACAYSGGPEARKWHPAGVSVHEKDPGKVIVSLPPEVQPANRWNEATARVVLGAQDGASVALGSLSLKSSNASALWAAGVTGVLLAFFMRLESSRRRLEKTSAQPRFLSGLFVGPDNDPSLSLLQILIWTVVTLWGMVYVYLTSGTLLSMTPEMMGLLGIAGASSVLARWAAVSGSGAPSSAPGQPKTEDVRRTTAREDLWSMLNTNGKFDLLKLQMLLFTIVIAAYVVAQIFLSAAFPQLDTNTLLLLGVSQGVYITGKLTSKSGLAAVQAIKAEIDLLNEQKTIVADAMAKLQREAAASADPAAATDLQKKAAAKQKEIDDITSALQTLETRYAQGLAELGLKVA